MDESIDALHRVLTKYQALWRYNTVELGLLRNLERLVRSAIEVEPGHADELEHQIAEALELLDECRKARPS